MQASCASALSIAVILLAIPAAAQPRDPLLTWRTVETPHFQVHYHSPLAYLARRTARVAERAHQTLRTLLGVELATKVQIVLTDDSDSANGSATALPFDTMRLYAEPPDDLGTLGEYDDWLTTLVSHEHTHILHLDQTSGLASFINQLLGRVYMPNHLAPRWLLEGLAVWVETELTSGGRLRSSQWDMYLRADILEGRVWDIDQVSNGADRWPHGHAAYLYGSYFVRFIAERHGREALAGIVHEYGDSIIPYGINRVGRRTTGYTFVELWDQFIAERRAHYRAQQAQLERLGVRQGARLTHHGEQARSPRFLRDGTLIYDRSDNRSRAEIVVVDRDSGEPSDSLARLNMLEQPAPHPDGRSIVFSRVDNHREIYFFSDLVRRDLESGQETRLTHGLRARAPDISSTGRQIVFTTTAAGTTQLMIAELADVEGTMRPLLESGRFEQFYSPRFSPDDRYIAVSSWRHGGYRDLLLIERASGRVFEITHDRALDTSPVFSADGEIIYFSSDRTGIANIYAYHRTTGHLRQVTNVINGAYEPAISPDGATLVYVGYTSFGFDLFSMPLIPDGFRDAPRDQRARPRPSNPRAPSTGDLWTAESRAYDPLPTLYPRSYRLDLTPDAFGSAVGLSVQGQDVVGIHFWSTRLAVGLVRGNLGVNADYAYQLRPFSISVSGFRNITNPTGLIVSGDDERWIQESYGGSVTLGYSFPQAFRNLGISASYGLTYTRPAEPFWTGQIDPDRGGVQRPEYGRFSTLRFGVSYSDLERYGYDISTSNGRSFGLGVSLADPLLGSQFHVVTFTWSAVQFIPLPWESTHVLALRYAGGISGGDLGRRGIFGVGGFPTVDLVSGAGEPVVLGGSALRGYTPNDRVGTQYHLAQAEYRFLVYRFNRGLWTLPVYFNRIWATGFVDWGDAFFDQTSLERFRWGVGGELHIEFTVFYFIQLSLRIGYARGVSEGGLDQFYGHFGVPF